MTDDSFYAPNRTPKPARQPKPGEPLWSLRKDNRQIDCELRYHGEWGVEAQILKDRELLHARTFVTRELAVQWAEETRKDLETGGV